MLDVGCHRKTDDSKDEYEVAAGEDKDKSRLEALGGADGCHSDWVELETQVQELRWQVQGLERERNALREALANSEEQTTQLMEELRKARSILEASKAGQ